MTSANLRVAMLAAPILILAASGTAASHAIFQNQRPSRAATQPCVPSATRVAHLLSGEVKAGEVFEGIADRFVLRLDPVRYANVQLPVGWGIGVYERGREQDLSEFTLPLRGPNDRHLVAWHFRNADNTAPNDGSVNAPQDRRELIFSPEVGRTIVYQEDATRMLAQVDLIAAFGRVSFDVIEFQLTEPKRGEQPGFRWLKFSACVTWPR